MGRNKSSPTTESKGQDDQYGYFSIPPASSGFGGESVLGFGGASGGGSLPTPALSSASLSGRTGQGQASSSSMMASDQNTNTNTSSPSKQRRRRTNTGVKPFSLTRLLEEIEAGLTGGNPNAVGGANGSGKVRQSPLPSPKSMASSTLALPVEVGGYTEGHQVRVRGNSTANKRPEIPDTTIGSGERASYTTEMNGEPEPSERMVMADGANVEEMETVPLMEALRETIGQLGWTLGMLAGVFVLSLVVVAGLLTSLPM